MSRSSARLRFVINGYATLNKALWQKPKAVAAIGENLLGGVAPMQ